MTPQDTVHPPYLEENYSVYFWALAAVGVEGTFHNRSPTNLKEEFNVFLPFGTGVKRGVGTSQEKGIWRTLQMQAPTLAP